MVVVPPTFNKISLKFEPYATNLILGMVTMKNKDRFSLCVKKYEVTKYYCSYNIPIVNERLDLV